MTKSVVSVLLAVSLMACSDETNTFSPIAEGFELTGEQACYITNNGDYNMPYIHHLIGAFNHDETDKKVLLDELDKTLERGCNPNELDEYKISPIQAAVISSRIDIIQVLLRYGADPFAKLQYQSQHFYQKNSFEIADLMVKTKPTEKNKAMNDFLHQLQSR